MRNLLKSKIKLQTHYMPLHYHSYYKKNFLFSKKKFANSENFYNSEVSLPIYYDLSLSNVNRISKKIISLLVD